MSSIIASNISNTVSLETLEEFFSFCGKIKEVKQVSKGDKTQEFEVTFVSDKALTTALLLNDAELDGVPIKVKNDNEQESSTEKELPPRYSEAAGNSSDTQPKLEDATKTGDSRYDDISQEEKPKYAIMAQLLGNGYALSDHVIQRSIEIDNQKGYSTKFKDFLTNLDEKYIHSSDPDSSASKRISNAQSKFENLQNSFSQSKYSEKLSHYFEKASNHPYGIKIHDFYKNLAKDVKDVHQEALRLKDLKKQRESSAQDN